jgi:hypothetical protein
MNLADAVDVHDGRTMHAEELCCVESRLQLVHRLAQQVRLASHGGFTKPSKANEAASDMAVEPIAQVSRTLLASLVTTADPRDREIEAERARARNAARFGMD